MRVIQSLASRLGETAAKIATNNAAVSAGITGLGRFTGSQGHTAVLAIGRTFGHSFRPWQAVRLTQTIGRAATVLSVVSVVLDIALEIKEQRDEEKREREALEARQNVRAEFARIAAQVEREAWNSTESFTREVLEGPLQEIMKARDDLNLAREEKNHRLESLNRLWASMDELIRRIHSGASHRKSWYRLRGYGLTPSDGSPSTKVSRRHPPHFPNHCRRTFPAPCPAENQPTRRE